MYLRVCGYVSPAVCVPRMPDARTLASPCAPGPRNLPPVPELSAQPQKAATAMIARWHLNRAADQSPPSLLPFHSFPLSSPSRRSDSKFAPFPRRNRSWLLAGPPAAHDAYLPSPFHSCGLLLLSTTPSVPFCPSPYTIYRAATGAHRPPITSHNQRRLARGQWQS